MVKFFVVLVVFVNGIVDKNIIIDIGDGIMQIGGSCVCDIFKVGKVDFMLILKKLSNIGVVKLVLEMLLEVLLGMYSLVGLGEMFGLDLVGEMIGIFLNCCCWLQFEIVILLFGYGLVIMFIQLVYVYVILGNYGKY